MDINELKILVLKGEGQTLEFKRKANHPEKIAREIVAFANSNGGILLIGVEDDKTIYGSKVPDEEIFAVTHHLELYAPLINYTFEKLPSVKKGKFWLSTFKKAIKNRFTSQIICNPNKKMRLCELPIKVLLRA